MWEDVTLDSGPVKFTTAVDPYLAELVTTKGLYGFPAGHSTGVLPFWIHRNPSQTLFRVPGKAGLR